jgi:hypothetical protein
MGRPSYGTAPDKGVKLFRVVMVDGDYDNGGAYWGGYPSPPLYCARTPDYQAFTRAHSRTEAATKLGIKPEQLARGLHLNP